MEKEIEKVSNLILEFLKIEDKKPPPGLNGVTGLSGLIDTFLLIEIVEKIIFKTKNEKEIKKILKNVDEFKILRYYQVLKTDEANSFKNLKFLIKARKELQEKTKGLV